ncbi:secondary thiamine-phosphate synthase enzyme [Thermanaerovibrio velox DSM 12556]|uniref:Secondary thiamine-phosphate synthase enzyme n=1 Tax=Thermanaerovibrio velox DSM 12556 TaxID=926567 RepID=H0UP56_9BACT|nr:secondary thiamine-phosphate synthase enzyme YjbQ [Thermanaerovibrio velox]EHM09469.1 secondary thiamine-phosphate synthase enzyme [Thermanaerovibrio velox DSM 12556]
MKSHTEYLWMNTPRRKELVHITPLLDEILERSGISDGFMLVSAMHITSGIIVNDNESGLHKDIMEWLERLAPEDPSYQHHLTGEDNGDAHLKRILVHHQAVIPVTDGKLDLGPWERVFYAEFDGQRRKRVVVKVIGI